MSGSVTCDVNMKKIQTPTQGEGARALDHYGAHVNVEH